ncbi:MAG: MBL fold metallo-hydrolase [Gemmatimonadaceae bacterium]|nr:MBL fold metallo-hydrolase [Gemmatimonadaceae bacterium]
MFFRQLYDTALAQASYVIGCQATGEAIVIDPLRDPAPYLAVAKAEGLRITHITETHIHADFVSGARELRAACGAQLYLSAEGGSDWQYAYAATDGATLLHDGDRIVVGNIHLDVMHTPGHTPEHLSFIVTDTPRAAGPMGVLTGDFVFVGDVGRPDLLERAAKIANTMEAGARTLFHSLERFRALPDHLQVWPGHGAGSACGKALGAVPSSTVGYEKMANWGVGTTDEATFVQMVLDGQPEPPRYFAEMKRLNRDGPPVLGARAPLPRLEAADVLALGADHWVIDLRSAAAAADGYVSGTLNVPLSKSFSTYVGSLLPITAPVVLLASESPNSPERTTDTAPDSVTSTREVLAHVGFDQVIGWAFADPVLAQATAAGRVASMPQVAPAQLQSMAEIPVIDVRGRSEWDGGHLPGARHLPLGSLPEEAAALASAPLVVQCQSGGRSAIAASLIARAAYFAGHTPLVRNLAGGYLAWRGAGLPVTSGD